MEIEKSIMKAELTKHQKKLRSSTYNYNHYYNILYQKTHPNYFKLITSLIYHQLKDERFNSLKTKIKKISNLLKKNPKKREHSYKVPIINL